MAWQLEVAAVHMRSVGDLGANRELCRKLVAEAAAAGARLVVLPECFSFRGRAEGDTSRVAEHDVVRRSTCYRAVGDEADFIGACSTHWQLAYRPPPVEPWIAVDDPNRRLARALSEIYAYYRGAGTMMENVLRDEAAVPVLTDVLGRFRGYLSAVQEILMAGRKSRGAAHRKTRAAIGHAPAYTTWQSLTRDNQLTDAEAADVMAQLAATLGNSAPRPHRRR